jgi:hypothetical protein
VSRDIGGRRETAASATSHPKSLPLRFATLSPGNRRRTCRHDVPAAAAHSFRSGRSLAPRQAARPAHGLRRCRRPRRCHLLRHVRPMPCSDAKVANSVALGVSGGRSLTREVAHAHRFATPAGFPRLDCSPFAHVHVRRVGLGFVRRSRAILCRAVPNLSATTFRDFCVAECSPSCRRLCRLPGNNNSHELSRFRVCVCVQQRRRLRSLAQRNHPQPGGATRRGGTCRSTPDNSHPLFK